MEHTTESHLAGKVALVTGGSRGIGKAIAGCLAGAGAKVMITSRKAEACEATVAELATETGGDLAYEAGNVGRVEDMERVVGATIGTFGALDILVNNAATNPYAGPTIDVDLPRWQKTLDVNLTAPLAWIQFCWNAWMKEHGGNIVNISSVG
ncbi:MAG: SDR family NAD(P)-dependent oxidoreductase, partial [Actinomycetota bacterium]|nr:SDR family NAD(P)-dependent oxidoreductase [Actinomycetota bacterium]